MKKQIYFLPIALLFTSFSFGQATLEHSYTTTYTMEDANDVKNILYSFNTQNGLNYFTFNNLTNSIQVYNEGHTLINTIVFPDTPVDIVFVTDMLFNSDNLIEILYTYETTDGGGNTITSMKMINENGVVIQTISDRKFAKLIKNNNSNFKLIVSKVDYSQTSGTTYMYNYDVYSLSGTLSLAQEEIYLKNSFVGFPNPTSNKININNPLSVGENQTLQVFDSSGKIIMEKSVTGNGEIIELNVSNISAGIYYIKLPTVKGIQSIKFIKE